MHSEVIGRVVMAKAGRDKGRSFVVIATEGDEFVLMVNGSSRKLSKPKKKKLKHLTFGSERLDMALLPKDSASADAFIRKALESMGCNDKTESEEG